MNNAAAKQPYDYREIVTERKPPSPERNPNAPHTVVPSPAAHSVHEAGIVRVQPNSGTISFPSLERLLNASEVAERLGVSERWVRDHTTRRSPKIRGVKLGTLMRYRAADVEEFMHSLFTSTGPRQRRN